MAKKRIIVTEEELINLVLKSIFKGGKKTQDTENKVSSDPLDISKGSTSVSDSEYKEKVVKLLGNYEGFSPTAYPDRKGLYAIGYGSTYVDGIPVKDGDTITKEKAMRQKYSDIDKFKNTIIGQIGQTAWNNLDMDTRVVLTSIAYNYGSIPPALLDSVKRGDKSEIHDIIKYRLSQHNSGINDWRREDEAGILASGESKRVPSYDA